jgi:hypothetical protein
LRFATADVVQLRAAAVDVDVVGFTYRTLSDSARLTVLGNLPGGCAQPSPTQIECSSWPRTLDRVETSSLSEV